MRRFQTFSLLALCLILVSGCTAKVIEETRGFVFSDPTNLKERNYATADYLVSQVQTFIYRPRDVLKVIPLVDIDQPTLQAPVGKLIGEQIGERFSKLGYIVDLSEVTNAQDTLYMDSAQNEDPDFVLSGHYQSVSSMFKGGTISVNLRIMDTETGRVITTYDYSLPYTSDLRELGKPEPRIFKMPN